VLTVGRMLHVHHIKTRWPLLRLEVAIWRPRTRWVQPQLPGRWPSRQQGCWIDGNGKSGTDIRILELGPLSLPHELLRSACCDLADCLIPLDLVALGHRSQVSAHLLSQKSLPSILLETSGPIEPTTNPRSASLQAIYGSGSLTAQRLVAAGHQVVLHAIPVGDLISVDETMNLTAEADKAGPVRRGHPQRRHFPRHHRRRGHIGAV